jgi:photosystem II stability/assembly factor-like uncharacterized protein
MIAHMSPHSRLRLVLSACAALVTVGALSAPMATAAPAAPAAPAAAAAAAAAKAGALPSWQLVDTGTTSHYRGLSVVTHRIVWLGGYNGTVLRTTNGGRSWANVSPAGADTLQFRDISAFDAKHAVAMAAGTATDSRLYSTSDGGRTWQLAYQNTDPAAFFDCMSFFDPQHGLVLSDPVGGKFRILSTSDGGASWTVLPSDGMPAALPGEAGFAASGECLTTDGQDAWFGGGGGAARVFHSSDGGLTWDVAETPVRSSPTAGIFGLAVSHPDGHRVVLAVGGSFAQPTRGGRTTARSVDGGPWRRPKVEPHGYRSGVTFLPGHPDIAVAVGLNGSDITYDAGRTWTSFDTGQFDTVSCAPDGACWASGDLGRVAKLR